MLIGDKARLWPDDSPAGTSWKSSKKKVDIHLRNVVQSQALHKQEDIYNKCKGPLTSSRAKYKLEVYHSKKSKDYKERLKLRHLSIKLWGQRRRRRAAPGGGIVAPGEGVKEAGAEVEEAAKGEIIDTMLGTYVFALSKKPRNSDRGRSRKELTFSQSTSAPRCTERPFIRRIGSSGVSKDLTSFFNSAFSMSALCVGHNPMEIRVSMRLANSKISWMEVQFASSRLTAATRESSSGCAEAEGIPVCSIQSRKKDTLVEYKNKQLKQKKRKRHGIYLQQEPTSY
jgi:hypothetical protein